MHIKKTYIVFVVLLLTLTNSTSAQFYNGYQVQFGKNRVQYDILEWVYFRHERFDTYYYANGEELARFVNKIADKKMKEYERFFEYSINKRLIFQVFNNLSDFRQSNIGYLSNSLNSNIGGTVTIFLNRAFIYFDGDFQKFEAQISAAVAELYINQMLLGESFGSKIANSTLLSLPKWYTKGLVKYLSEDWNTDLDDQTKDAVLSGKFDKFNNLNEQDEILAGHSIWNYIANRYGKNVIPNIVYISRISKSIENGLMFVIGTSFKFLMDEWIAYYYDLYAENETTRTGFEKNEQIFKTKENRVYQHLEVCPISGEIAYTTNEMGKYIIWIFNPKTGKRKRILRKAHRLQQITDYTYPLIAWHPNTRKLGYIFEEKGGIWFGTYNMETKEKNENEIFKFLKINQFKFSKDNKNLIMTAVQKGQSDIYLYNLLSHTYKQITNDKAEEKWASFLKDSESILFSSNRVSDSLQAKQTQKTYDLFIYNPNLSKLRRITNTPKENELQATETDKLKFLYLNDQNGIQNLAYAKYDSSISFIDTTIHYKYYANTYKLSDFNRNIHNFHYENQKLNILNHWESKDHYFSKFFSISRKAHIPTLVNTYWKTKENQNIIRDSLMLSIKDSLKEVSKTIVEKSDTNHIDFYNYIFDLKKLKKDELNKNNTTKKDSSKTKNKSERPFYYFTSFYKDNLVTQIDFQFLNEFYQTYTGSAVYQNPGMNVYMKLGVADLFENYRFTAATKLGIDLSSNEFLFSLENNKKRLDKQYIFYRQTFKESFVNSYFGKYYILKTYSHQFQYRLRYPFSQVTSIRTTLSYRNDLVAWKATNPETLMAKDNIKNWVGTKLEYVFDNALSLGINLHQGWKIKIFGEAYFEAKKNLSDLYVTGFDVRYYQKIHRNLIWASRVAGSSAFGKNRLIYYLGSTDNWIRFSNKVPQFDESVQRNSDIKWAFQSLATNMRGFPQNVRNGSTFFVANNEIRFPIFNYFSNAPLSSTFLNNFQIVGFFDIGSAWTGISPYDKLNKYNQDTKIEKPISITIDNQKAPFIYGYGAGIRTKLLGYFIRGDIAWGIDGDIRLNPIFYLSLSLDF